MKTFYCDDYPDDGSAFSAALAWQAEHNETVAVMGRGAGTAAENETKDE